MAQFLLFSIAFSAKELDLLRISKDLFKHLDEKRATDIKTIPPFLRSLTLSLIKIIPALYVVAIAVTFSLIIKLTL